jgi:hypothetical protein
MAILATTAAAAHLALSSYGSYDKAELNAGVAADVFRRTQNTFPIFQSIRVISAFIGRIYI